MIIKTINHSAVNLAVEQALKTVKPNTDFKVKTIAQKAIKILRDNWHYTIDKDYKKAVYNELALIIYGYPI